MQKTPQILKSIKVNLPAFSRAIGIATLLLLWTGSGAIAQKTAVDYERVKNHVFKLYENSTSEPYQSEAIRILEGLELLLESDVGKKAPYLEQSSVRQLDINFVRWFGQATQAFDKVKKQKTPSDVIFSLFEIVEGIKTNQLGPPLLFRVFTHIPSESGINIERDATGEVFLTFDETPAAIGGSKSVRETYRYRDWTPFALSKLIKDTPTKRAKFENEKRFLQIISQFPEEERSGFVQAFAIRDESILFPFYPHGDLFETLKLVRAETLSFNLTDRQILEILRNLVFSMNSLHKRGFIYGDVKPENILVKELGKEKLTLLIADFDQSYSVSDSLWAETRPHVGTREYNSPEFFQPKIWPSLTPIARMDYLFKQDVFAMATVLSEIAYIPEGGITPPWQDDPLPQSCDRDLLIVDFVKSLSESTRRGALGDLDRLLAKALAPKLEDRLNSFELLDGINQIITWLDKGYYQMYQVSLEALMFIQ